VETIRAKAAELKQAVGGDETQEAGPARAIDLGVWVALISAVLQAFQDCKKKPAALPQAARRPGLAGRLRLRQIVRNTTAHADLNDETVRAVVRHCLAVGAATTEREAAAMFREAKAQTAEK